MNDKQKDTTLYERLKTAILNNWFFAICGLVILAAVSASQFLKATQDIIAAVFPEKTKLSMLTTISEGGPCGMELIPTDEMNQKSSLDIAINNNSGANVMLTSVTLEPQWVAGSFFAGELKPSAEYNIDLRDWLEMAQQVNLAYSREKYRDASDPQKHIDERNEFNEWCKPKFGAVCTQGVQGLIEADRAKVDSTAAGTLWVKPDPIEVKAISANKFVINKDTAEKILIHLGLPRSIDYLVGDAVLVVKTDTGETQNSAPIRIAICTP